VGCEYFSRGYSNVIPESLTEEELSQAADIYAFDLLVQNPDRTKYKPNCTVRSGHLKPFDFENAFSFVYLIGKHDEPWEVSKHGIAPKHLFHSELKRRRREVSFRPFIRNLRRIDEGRLDRLIEGFPDNWLQHESQIRSHLLAAGQKARKLEFELRRSLL